MISRRASALAGIVIVTIVWGSTFVATKAAVHEIPPLTPTCLRFLIAAAVLVPIAAARGALRRLPQPCPVTALALMGLTGVAIFHVGFTYALVYGSAAQGAIVFALGPAAVVVAAVVALKEAPSKRRIAGILLSVCGVALVVATGESGSASPTPLLGAALMLGVLQGGYLHDHEQRRPRGRQRPGVFWFCARARRSRGIGGLSVVRLTRERLSRRPRPRGPESNPPGSVVVPCTQMAHALTTVRLLLILPFALLMAHEEPHTAALAAAVLAVAIATDVLDGIIARRRGTASAAGGLFDHTTDCLFVAAGLAATAVRGAAPWLLPALVVTAFAQYVADSYWLHRGRALRTSRLGRWNGILYFVPLVVDLLVRLGWGALRPVLSFLVWTLVASTLVSMGERLWAVRELRRTARGSLAAGTGDRSRH